MIGLALPWVAGLALAGALAITALHLLSVRRPPELLLPTARFLPDREVRAVSRTKRPSDLLLLAVRIAILLAAGLAAAGPHWRATARTSVVLVVADRGVARDTAIMGRLVTGGGRVAPRNARVEYVFAQEDARTDDDPAALFPVAWRAAARLAARDAAIDSFDLHVLLSQAPAGSDAGLAAWRGAWPGRVITHQPVIARRSRRLVVIASDSVGARDADDDVVRRAVDWHAARMSQANASSVSVSSSVSASTRDSTTRPDITRIDTIALARGDGPLPATSADDARRDGDSDGDGDRIRVSWPVSGVPAGWRAMFATDSASALVATGQALMGPWPVTATPVAADTARAIAWWSDGRVAAVERRTARGCAREVAVVSAVASDALLAASANGVFERLLATCSPRAPVPASALTVQIVSGSALAGAADFRRPRGAARAPTEAGDAGDVAWVAPALYSLALLLLLAEWRMRTRQPDAVA